MVGYGARQPHPRWPGGARVALQIVLNYEEDAPQGFNSGAQFFAYLRDAFDLLYTEGGTRLAKDAVDRPALPHRRRARTPYRIGALPRPVRHHDKGWIARRIDVVRHWIATYPYMEKA